LLFARPVITSKSATAMPPKFSFVIIFVISFLVYLG
jgi:hypothetical protein